MGFNSELFVAVDNVMNLNPPRVPSEPATVAYVVASPGTRVDLYDTIGRMFRLGLRVGM
jgi:hypothetical protein